MPRWLQALQAWLRSLGESRRVDIETFSRNWEEVSTRMLEENAKFRSVLEAAPDAMVIFNEAGRIVLVNSQTERMFGYPRQELLGREIELLIPERFRREHVRYRVEYASAPRPSPRRVGLEIHCGSKDGTEFPVEIRLNPLQTGKQALTISTIRDVTELKRTERLLKETAQELVRSNKDLEQFAFAASHDLRAPLRRIDGFSETLERSCGEHLGEEGRAHLARIRTASRNMSRLIDAMLEMGRITRCELRRAPVDLTGLAMHILEDLRQAEPTRNVRVTIAEALTVQGDVDLLRTALTNLLSNAWKFTAQRKGAEIRFGAERGEGETTYFIRDNGVGFDMAFVEKLFVAFQKLHRPSEFSGSGIGLATVKRIIERHGGRVWAEGTVSGGATFFFTLP